MQNVADEVWNGIWQTAHNVIERSQGATTDPNNDGFFGGRKNSARVAAADWRL